MPSRSKIEWLRDTKGKAGYSINPIKGICQHGCPYCYSTRMYKRFKWDPTIRLDLSVFDDLSSVKPGSKIFLCSTHDICGSWIKDEWIELILAQISLYPELIFVLLTKVPGRLWGFDLPENTWLGTTVESQAQAGRIETLLAVNNKLRFISFEPLQSNIDCDFTSYRTNERISWVIIGNETGNRRGKIDAKQEWVDNIIRNTDENNIPVFIKDNLLKRFPLKLYERQEYPVYEQPPARSPRRKETC